MIHKVSSRWKVVISSLWYNWNGKKATVWSKARQWYYYFFKPFDVIFIAYQFFFSDGKYDDIKDTTLCLFFSLICLLKTLLICFIIVITIMLFDQPVRRDTAEQTVAWNAFSLHMVRTAHQNATVLSKIVIIETDAIVQKEVIRSHLTRTYIKTNTQIYCIHWN